MYTYVMMLVLEFAWYYIRLLCQPTSPLLLPMSSGTNATYYTCFFFLSLENSDGQPISPWQDIPLFANADRTVLNMVVEIPRWTNAKMEVG